MSPIHIQGWGSRSHLEDQCGTEWWNISFGNVPNNLLDSIHVALAWFHSKLGHCQLGSGNVLATQVDCQLKQANQ